MFFVVVVFNQNHFALIIKSNLRGGGAEVFLCKGRRAINALHFVQGVRYVMALLRAVYFAAVLGLLVACSAADSCYADGPRTPCGKLKVYSLFLCG